MPSVSTTFRHAITPLVFDRTKLHRERLVDLIHADIPRKLIVITAPPGYGKSTLLADFAAHTDLPVCWLRLTEADCDVMRLAGVLAASLQRRFRRLRGRLDLALLSEASPQGLARAFADVMGTMIEESFVLAIDNIHLVNASAPAMAFLDALLEEQPSQVTWLVAGRLLPDLSLARLVANGEMAGIGIHDLALTHDELTALARLRLGTDLRGYDVERLLEETQGWMTGALLSAPMLGDASKALAQPGRPMVYEYLAAVVLGHQPEDLYRFMLEAAVLPVMTAPDCDEVLARQDSQRMLARLWAEGLFVVAAEGTPRSYEFHPQLREFLLETLAAKDPARLKALRIRAAAHLARHDAVEESADLYILAGAFRRVARLAEASAAALFRQGRIQTLEAWAQRLSSADAPTPGLHLYLATTYIDRADYGRAERALRTAFQMLEGGRPKVRLQARAWTVRGMLALQRNQFDDVHRAVREAERLLAGRNDPVRRATCLRLRARTLYASGGDLRQAEHLVRRALRLVGQTSDEFTLAVLLADLSLIQNARGSGRDAQDSAERAHAVMERLGAPLPLAVSYNNLAMASYEDGQYEEALRLFAEALKHARRAGSLRHEANTLFGQADLFSDLGLPLQAAELYEQGLCLAARLDNRHLLRYGYLQTSSLHRRCQTAALPMEWLERALALDSAADRPPMVDIQLAALSIASSPTTARRRIQALLRRLRPGLHAAECTLLYYYSAAASLRAGSTAQAKAALGQALERAGSHGGQQALAGELVYDECTRQFVADAFSGHPIAGEVLRRIDLMDSTARKYQAVQAQRPESAELGLNALGTSEVWLHGQRVRSLEPLPRQILFFLADSRKIERDTILETFWPDVLAGRRVSSLYTAMHAIRRSLGSEVIVIDGSIYALNPAVDLHFDVEAFERAAGIALAMPAEDPRRLFSLTEAVHLYSGDFLPESSTNWAVERRRELEGLFLRLLTLHAQEAYARGQWNDAVGSYRQALTIDPLGDDLNLNYLELLGRLNRRSEAVGHYQRYTRLLSDELGVEPPPAIREAYARLIC